MNGRSSSLRRAESVRVNVQRKAKAGIVLVALTRMAGAGWLLYRRCPDYRSLYRRGVADSRHVRRPSGGCCAGLFVHGYKS
ncbi:MAG: hypothetical protein ACLVJ8_06775 [Ruthenibacterium lactatiformans]